MGAGQYAIPGYGQYAQNRDLYNASQGTDSITTLNTVDRNKPSTFANRGTFIPYLLGHKRVGAVILWVGDRTAEQEVVGSSSSRAGGKGGGKKKRSTSTQTQTVYFEGAWHGLCVGPATRLHRIWKNGRVVFDAQIDSGSNPSGSSFTTDDGDEFTIYWGGNDLGSQPVNLFLGDAARDPVIGINSSWPNLCYVVWEKVKLGPSPRWPTLEYEIEVGVSHSTGLLCNIQADGETSPGSGVYPNPDMDPALNGGYNEYYGSHIVDQILFAEWPQGLALDEAMVEFASIQELAVLLSSEGIFASALAPGGLHASELIRDLMVDLGFLITWEVNWNPVAAVDWSKLVFRAIREPAGTLPTLPTDVLTQNEVPEVQIVHWEIQATKTVWQFADRTRDYTDMTIQVDEDGEVDFLKHAKAQKVPVPTATSFKQAGFLVERRSQEILANPVTFKFYASKEARYLMPGRAFLVAGLSEVFRVKSIEVEQFSDQVTIEAAIDFYGVEAGEFLPASSGAPATGRSLPLPDLAIKLVEFPAELSGGQVTVVAPRIRANDKMRFADLYLSPDNVSYQFNVRDNEQQTGGTLDEAIAADAPHEIENGPLFTAIGPDIANVVDYTGNEAQWRAGKQMVCINDEIFFLRNIEPIAGTQYRLRGLLRARYNTRRAAHAVSDVAYIIDEASLQLVTDSLLQPEADIYLKAQPVANTPLSLASAVAVSKLPLYGLGVRPEPPYPVLITAPLKGSNDFRTGEDVSFEWAYFQQGVLFSGAGLQNAGTPTSPTPFADEFKLEFLTLGDVVQRTVILSAPITNPPTYTYTNADLVTDFGSEQSYKMRIYHQLPGGGYISDFTETIVTFVP